MSDSNKDNSKDEEANKHPDVKKDNSSIPVAHATYAQFPPQHNFSNSNLPADFNPANFTTTRYAEVPPENEHLQICWQYGKSVKCFAILDGILLFLNVFSIPRLWWLWFLLLICPIFGYKGAKQYCMTKTNSYLIFSTLMWIGRVILLIQIYNGTFDSNDKIMSGGSQFLAWITLFARTWITWIIYKFSSMLGKLSDIQLNTLQIGTFIPITTTILYY